MRPPTKPIWSYGCSALAVVVATLVWYHLAPHYGDRYAPLNFLVAVVFASWYGGLNPGLLALCLSVPALCFFVMGLQGSIDLRNLEDRLGLVNYLISGLAIALMGGSMRHAQARAERGARDAEDRRDLLEREVNDRHKAEVALREIQERLELVIDAADVGVWDYDAGRAALVFNERCQGLFGLRLGENADLEVLRQAVHRDDRARVDESIRRAIVPEGGGDLDVEFRGVGSPGAAERWVVARGRSFFDGSGRPVRVIGTLLDITASKKAERAARFLADSSAILAEMVDEAATLGDLARLAVPCFADRCIVDLVREDGSIAQAAVAHPEADRRDPPEFDDLRGPERVVQCGEAQLVADMSEAMLEESAVGAEHLEALRRSGFRSWLCVPLKGRRGTVGSISFMTAESNRRFGPEDVVLAADLGRRAAIAIENARLHRELKQADRRKDEFLAVLAHELRNPLSTVRNALHLMKQADPEDSAGIEVERSMAARQVAHLARLVDDLMDVSRISLGKIELRKVRMGVAPAMVRVVESLAPAIGAREHTLTVEYPPAPVEIEADPTRFDQVLGNLLGNAIKYTEPGGDLSIAATVEGDEIAIRVGDTGLGIAAEMLPRIFEMFVQVDDRAERAGGGLGIGLGLVRTLVEMHGGRIAVRSLGLGHGSEFVATFRVLPPLADPSTNGAGDKAGRPARQAPSGATPRRRIMVVDDNRDAARTLAKVLERFYAQEVRVAHDGPSALDLATDFRPELVLLDIGMPGMGGHEVAMKLRQRPETEHALLIALTGWGQERDRRLSKEAGFDIHLVKPVAPETLGDILAQPPAIPG